jgi:predicted RNA-binding protein with PUA domain
MKFAFRCLLGHDWYPWSHKRNLPIVGWTTSRRRCRRCGRKEERMHLTWGPLT